MTGQLSQFWWKGRRNKGLVWPSSDWQISSVLRVSKTRSAVYESNLWVTFLLCYFIFKLRNWIFLGRVRRVKTSFWCPAWLLRLAEWALIVRNSLANPLSYKCGQSMGSIGVTGSVTGGPTPTGRVIVKPLYEAHILLIIVLWDIFGRDWIVSEC